MPIKTFRFRDFIVYKGALLFRKDVRAQLQKFPRSERFSLVDQLDRACLSVLLNIAEGSAKRSDKDFRRFLEIAIASLNEVIAGFDCAHSDGIISVEELRDIEQKAELLARQIGSFMRTLAVSQSANC